MASITVVNESKLPQGDVSDKHRLLPPNLVWRFAIAIQHKDIKISSTQSTGQSAIAVNYPLKGCSSVCTFCYIDFQRVLYHHLSDIPNNCIDHLGTYRIQSSKLLLEVHFISSDQVKRFIDELDKMVINKVLTKTFQSFLESFRGFELDITLVIQSNLEPRLRLVTRENAAFAFSIVYTDKPALTVFHIQNPEIYAPLKKAYSELLASFPDFLGESGAVDFSVMEDSTIQSQVVAMDETSGNFHTMHSNFNQSSQDTQIGKNIMSVSQPVQDTISSAIDSSLSCNSSILPESDDNSLTTTQESISENDPASQDQRVKSQNISKEEDRGHETCTTSKLLYDEQTYLDEELSEDDIGKIAAGIPPHLYKLLGNRLGLTSTMIDRIEYDNRGNSIDFILGILMQANKQEDATRRTFVTALLHCNLHKEAKILDNSLDISSLDQKPLGISPPSPAESLFLVDVDGHLYFYDQQLARQYLKKQQSRTFWKQFQSEIQSAISESLAHYGVLIHSTSVGSLIVHIKLKSYNQARMISTDVASGKLKDVVEVKIKAFGFTGVLAIDFKIDGIIVKPQQCYEVYVKSLLEKKPRLLPVLTVDIQKLQQVQQNIITAGKQIRLMEHQEHKPQSTTTVEKIKGVVGEQQQHASHDTTIIKDTGVVEHTPKSNSSSTNKEIEMKPLQAKVNLKAQPSCTDDSPVLSEDSNPEKDISLTDAIIHGTLQQLKNAIERGAAITDYQNGFLPLHVAAHHGKSDMIKSLVTHGANIEACTTTDEKVTALHLAAYSGHLEAVQTLVNLGAEIDATSANGATPLHFSACQRNVLVTKFLLEREANCNATNKDRKTPLYEAVTRGHQGIVKLLLHYGADVTLQTVQGETAIHHAIVIGDAEMLKLIVTAVPQALTQKNISTYEHPLITAVKLQKVPLVKIILDTKTDPNICNKDFMSPLAVASCLENLEIMELLVNHGAEINLSFPPHGTPLHIVADEGKVDAARKLLRMNIDPNILDSEGTTPLRRAVENKNVEVASLLLKHGANIYIECPGDEMSLLHKAAKRNDVKMMKLLIENGADPYETGIKGGTAMFTAAAHGSCDAVDLLSEFPGLINIANKGKFTPLMAAIYRRKYDCALQLLKHKPDVSLRNLDNMTVLYICIDFRAPEEVIEGILSCDVTINDPGPNGISPIDLACRRGFTELVVAMLDKNPGFLNRHPELSPTLVFEAIDAGSCGTLEALFQHGADPNCIHIQMPMTPLHLLCRQHTSPERMLQVVLDHHPDTNIVTEMGAPLHVAVATKKNTFVAMLLHNKADPNIASCSENATPLVIAAEMNNIEAAQLLLEHGGRVDHALSTNGYTALHKAASSNFIEMANLLIKYLVDTDAGVDQPSTKGYTPLHLAVSAGSQEVFALLIESDSNMNAQDNMGSTPLMQAINEGKNELALMLLELGADVHLGNIDGVHALHIAARVGALNIITRIIDLGANLDVQEENGVTPLFLAIVMAQVSAAKILIERGSSIDLCDIHQNTPLHIAAQMNNSEAVRLLVEHGANPTAQNMKGKTPKDVTESKNLEKLLETAATKQAERQSLVVKEVEYNLPGEGSVAAIAAGHNIRSKQQWHDIQNRLLEEKRKQK